MTKDEIHRLLDLIADRAPYPIKSFSVQDWTSMGEVQIGVTFKTGEGYPVTAQQQAPADMQAAQ